MEICQAKGCQIICKNFCDGICKDIPSKGPAPEVIKSQEVILGRLQVSNLIRLRIFLLQSGIVSTGKIKEQMCGGMGKRFVQGVSKASLGHFHGPVPDHILGKPFDIFGHGACR